jgi:hypothetical protein
MFNSVRARLVRNVIPFGSAVEDPNLSGLARELHERAIQRDPKLALALRKHAMRAGTEVEVLDIYDQRKAAPYYKTPTPPGIVVLCRGLNWDGEEVTVALKPSDLDIFQGSEWRKLETRPEDWLAAFAEWQHRPFPVRKTE